MAEDIYAWGDTIQVGRTYKDSAGTEQDLDAAPSVTLYTPERVLVQALGASTHTGTGVYEVEFEVPEYNVLVLEWLGTLGGEPVRRTNRILAAWFAEDDET